METKIFLKQSLECCQWNSQIEHDHNGVVEELRRLHFMDEEREDHELRFKNTHAEIQTLLDDLRTWTALSMNTRKCSMITSFVDKVAWSWQDAESRIRYEVNEIKLHCCHVTSNCCLHEYAERTKKSIHETFRFLFGQRLNPTTLHPGCIDNFGKLHDVITPKLSRLLQCDNVNRELVFHKRATPFRQHQRDEIQSFIAAHLQTSNITIPPLLTNPTVENSFAQLSQLLTGDLLGEDPLDTSVAVPVADHVVAVETYPEPLAYREFKTIALPVARASQVLARGRPGAGRGMSMEHCFVVADMASHASGWEMASKGARVGGVHEPKKRGPYKKRVVNCELVKKDVAEALTPIKVPKLRGNLLSPLN